MDNFEFSKSYTLEEFVAMVNSEPNKWINYLEIIILPNGLIQLARPSHQMALIHYAMEKDHISYSDIQKSIPLAYAINEFLIDKYKCICVWYNYFIRPEHGMETIQEDVIKELVKQRLLSPYITFKATHEYELALERGDVGGG